MIQERVGTRECGHPLIGAQTYAPKMSFMSLNKKDAPLRDLAR